MKLLDTIKERYSIKNDAELSRTLDVPPPTISKIRSGRVNVSADIILRIHECLGMPVADIRSLLESANVCSSHISGSVAVCWLSY